MMMGKKFWMASAGLLALTAAANASEPASAATSTVKPANVAKPVQVAQNAPVQMAQNNVGASNSASDLEARVKALEDAVQASQDRATADRTRLSTVEQNYAYAAWTYDNGRPTLATGDGRFTMAIRLRFQTDFAGFSQASTHPAGFAGPADLSSGAVIRRAYFGVEGKVYNDWWYEFRLNGGGSDGGNNATCTATTATTITAPAGGAATSASTCAIGSIEPAGEGDPLVNKAVITYTGIPNWHFNVGVIEPSFMMEGSTTSKDLVWLERPEIENIAADSFGAGDSRRGVEIGWSQTDTLWPGDNLGFDVAFTGQKTGTAATHGNGGDEGNQFLGRATDRLWSDGISNIQIGASGGYDPYTGNTAGGGSQTLRFRERPEIRVDGTRLIDTGAIAAKRGHMWAADLEGNWQNFYLGGEYAEFTMDRQCGSLIATNNALCTTSTAVIDHPGFHGYDIGGSWIITGETRTYVPSGLAETQASFGAPVPSRPFSLQGGSWGAWEVAARYSETDLNWHSSQLAVTNTLGTSQLAGVLGGEQRVLDLALNWYPNRNIRLMIDDNIVTVKKGTAAVPNQNGQSLNIVGVRLQFAN
ncbi:MAG TPA: porin [Rhizomicrobium sp.]|nr:porin [Rhizomicrobium sp.]